MRRLIFLIAIAMLLAGAASASVTVTGTFLDNDDDPCYRCRVVAVQVTNLQGAITYSGSEQKDTVDITGAWTIENLLPSTNYEFRFFFVTGGMQTNPPEIRTTCSAGTCAYPADCPLAAGGTSTTTQGLNLIVKENGTYYLFFNASRADNSGDWDLRYMCSEVTCTDSDLNNDPLIKGLVTFSNGTTVTDSCYDNYYLDAVCWISACPWNNPQICHQKIVLRNCPEGTTCQNNVCVSSSCEIDLKNFPCYLINNQVFNGYLVVGEVAPAMDNLAASDIAISLSYRGEQVTFVNFAAKLDTEIADISSNNLISIGSPCVNSVSALLMGNPVDCIQGLTPGEGRLKLFPQNNGKVILLVDGYNAADTRMIANVLTHRPSELSGREVRCASSDGDWRHAVCRTII